MFKNYLKVAFRNFTRQKGFSFINVLGLALGMAVSLLLLLWVQDELQFDNFHDNLDNIYQISMINEDTSPASVGRTIPNQLVPVILENFSEVKNAARIHSINDLVLTYENKTFQEDNFLLAESNFLEIFSFSLIEGNPQTALTETTSIILTKSSAEKFFGKEPAMGKSLMINSSIPFTVTGIIEDCPEKSSIYFDYIMPFAVTGGQGDPWSWGSSGFIELDDNISLDSFREKFRTALVDYSPRDIDKDMLYLQSFARVHLFSANDKPEGMNLVFIFSAIGLIILFLAWINFVNLTTARSVKRAREIGVRKVVGAQRK
jgi:putative ABC transport system permease protein